MERQVTFTQYMSKLHDYRKTGYILYALVTDCGEPHQTDYRRTSYISPQATTPTWLQKDKLHFPSSYHTNLVTEGQVTFSLRLPNLPGYEFTSHISPPATKSTWLWKDKLHYPSSYQIHLVTEGQEHFPSSYHTDLITEEQVTYPLQLPHPPGFRRTSYISPPATAPT